MERPFVHGLNKTLLFDTCPSHCVCFIYIYPYNTHSCVIMHRCVYSACKTLFLGYSNVACLVVTVYTLRSVKINMG